MKAAYYKRLDALEAKLEAAIVEADEAIEIRELQKRLMAGDLTAGRRLAFIDQRNFVRRLRAGMLTDEERQRRHAAIQRIMCNHKPSEG